MARQLTQGEREELIAYMQGMKADEAFVSQRVKNVQDEGSSPRFGYLDAGDKIFTNPAAIYRTIPSIEENFESLPLDLQQQIIRGGRARDEARFMGASGGSLVTPDQRRFGLLYSDMPYMDTTPRKQLSAEEEVAAMEAVRGTERVPPENITQTIPVAGGAVDERLFGTKPTVTTMPAPNMPEESNKGVFAGLLNAVNGVADRVAQKRGFTQNAVNPLQTVPQANGAFQDSGAVDAGFLARQNYPQDNRLTSNVSPNVGPFDPMNPDIMSVESFDPVEVERQRDLRDAEAAQQQSRLVEGSFGGNLGVDQVISGVQRADTAGNQISFDVDNGLGFKPDGQRGLKGDPNDIEYQAGQIQQDLEETIPEAKEKLDFGRLAKALALGFNTLRLNPDQQLASYLGKSLEEDRKRKLQGKTLGTVVKYLENKGYKDHADIARNNPNLAMDIYKQVVQQEMSAKASPKVSGVQFDADDNAFVVVSQGGETEVRKLNVKGRSQEDIYKAKLEADRVAQDLKTSDALSNDVMAKAYSLESKLSGYRRALNALQSGAKSGWIQNTFLPAFNAETSALRQAANTLGITVINSATFGALSETELRLALSTELDLNLPPEELEQQVIAKIEAAEKFRAELIRKAYELRSMPYSEYIEKQAMIARENEKYLRMPDDPDITAADWAMLNAQERKHYYQLADQ